MSIMTPLQVLAASLGDDALDVADVFSTDLWTGDGTSSQTVTNGVDLTQGGLVWAKRRNGIHEHGLYDTGRGVNKRLSSNDTAAEEDASTNGGVTAFNSDGFTHGYENDIGGNADTYVGWSFRKAAKFFDVVTYTGDGSTTGRTIPHSLGQAPGMIIIKATSTTSDWTVWHRSIGFGAYVKLNSTQSTSGNTPSHVEAVTADDFDLYTGVALSNTTGVDYVAYLFAHDTSDSGIIQCGSYTGNGSSTGPTVTLGWEPQFVLGKAASGGTGNWWIFDAARGLTNLTDKPLRPSASDAELGVQGVMNKSATGFQLTQSFGDYNANSVEYIYMAIKAEA